MDSFAGNISSPIQESDLPSGTFLIEKVLAEGDFSVEFDLSAYGFPMPPSCIFNIVKTSSDEPNISAYPTEPTPISAYADLSSPIPDGNYICQLQVTPP